MCETNKTFDEANVLLGYLLNVLQKQEIEPTLLKYSSVKCNKSTVDEDEDDDDDEEGNHRIAG